MHRVSSGREDSPSPTIRRLPATRDGEEHGQGTRALEARFYRQDGHGRTQGKKNGPDVFRHRGRRQTPYSLTGESESGVLALEASRFFDRFAFAAFHSRCSSKTPVLSWSQMRHAVATEATSFRSSGQ